MPEKHALLSASGSHKWLNCTPSARLEENYENITSSYMEEGTLAHALAELKLRKTYTTLSTRKYNSELKKIQENEMYNNEMEEATDKYKTLIDEIMYGAKEKPFIEIEKQIDYGNWAKEGFGTTDCVIIENNILHIIDFKYGKGIPVSAERNTQLMLYALGALDMYSMLFDIKIINLIIVQPRLDNINADEITKEELLEWGNNIVKNAANLAFEGQGEYNPGEWCRFCKAKGDCRERANRNLEAIKETKRPTLTNAEISCALTLTADVVDWIKDLQETALKKILAGEEIPGYKAVEGRSNRTITDLDKLFEVLKENGTEEALLYERKPLSISALEKLVGKSKFNQLASDYIDKPKGSPTLAKITDKRDSFKIGTTAEEDFKN